MELRNKIYESLTVLLLSKFLSILLSKLLFMLLLFSFKIASGLGISGFTLLFSISFLIGYKWGYKLSSDNFSSSKLALESPFFLFFKCFLIKIKQTQVKNHKLKVKKLSKTRWQKTQNTVKSIGSRICWKSVNKSTGSKLR